MAQFTFRGVDSAARALLEPCEVIADLDRPLDLPELLVLRRRAAALLRADARFAAASAVHIYADASIGRDAEPVAVVDRAHLSGGHAGAER
jgi:hypothetical protein